MVVEKYIIGSVLLIPTIILLFDSFLRCIYLFFLNPPITKPSSSKQSYRLAFVIVARNEADIIKDTLQKIRHEIAADWGKGVFVIADHCSDRTEWEAEDAGARVFIREEGDPGKGYALAWFAVKAGKELMEYDAVIIMDADSLIGPGYYQAVCDELSCGYSAIQSYIKPVVVDKSSPALLAAYSELLSQEIDDRARMRLGWSVPIRGTGIILRIPLFLSLAPNFCTQVEDIEMSIQLSLRNIPVEFAPWAVVLDPKVTNIDGLARQRGRWLNGQRQVWIHNFKNILKLLRQGLPQWSLIQALLLKPKTMLLTIKVIIALLWGLFPPLFSKSIDLTISSLTFIGIGIDLWYCTEGLFIVSDPAKYLVALLKFPIYLLVWVYGWKYSLNAGQVWLRARGNH